MVGTHFEHAGMASRRGSRPGARAGVIALAAFAAVWALAVFRWGVPSPLFPVYAGMSILAVVVYGIDKRRAITGGRRVSEATLLVVGVLCGWPGAIVGQQLFRHKTTKRSFRRAFWATVLLNVALFLLVTSSLARV